MEDSEETSLKGTSSPTTKDSHQNSTSNDIHKIANTKRDKSSRKKKPRRSRPPKEATTATETYTADAEMTASSKASSRSRRKQPTTRSKHKTSSEDVDKKASMKDSKIVMANIKDIISNACVASDNGGEQDLQRDITEEKSGTSFSLSDLQIAMAEIPRSMSENSDSKLTNAIAGKKSSTTNPTDIGSNEGLQDQEVVTMEEMQMQMPQSVLEKTDRQLMATMGKISQPPTQTTETSQQRDMSNKATSRNGERHPPYVELESFHFESGEEEEEAATTVAKAASGNGERHPSFVELESFRFESGGEEEEATIVAKAASRNGGRHPSFVELESFRFESEGEEEEPTTTAALKRRESRNTNNASSGDGERTPSFVSLNSFRFDAGGEGEAQESSTYGMDQSREDKGSIKKKIGFAVDNDSEKKMTNLEDNQPASMALERHQKNGITFRPVEYGSSEDDKSPLYEQHKPKAQRFYVPCRTSSVSSLNGSSSQQLRRNDALADSQLGQEAPIPQPQALLQRRATISTDETAPQRLRRRSSAESKDGSFTSLASHQRPGIQRRNSMSSNSQRRLSFDLTSSDNAGEGASSKVSRRPTILQAAQTVASINLNQETITRRLEMSAEHQTYIPPKSKHASMLEAVTHVMAGSMVELTLWTYGASFFKVLMFFLGVYLCNIFMWAAVLDAVDLASGGVCIHEEPTLLGRSDRYEFVFELAWATFTTVGYGTISPQGDTTGCYAIRFTCAFVAFIGVLFASTTAAIMYSKLLRLLAKAHITFSSTLCVQYGKGNEGSTVRFGQLNFRASVAPSALLKPFSNDDDDDGDGFPVIEFRIINDRANHEGSEIWDAQIRGIVQLHKEQPLETERNNSYNLDLKDTPTRGQESTLDLEKKVYYPISLSPESHPHFSRIWYARHVLNAESPLLKRDIRDSIVHGGGKWNRDYNNWEVMRDCLNEFTSLRITLSGTSAESASTVFGEHVYEFDDVCVGWRFANMVYEDKDEGLWSRFGFVSAAKGDKKYSVDTTDTRTKIDALLLHDIFPQPGGDFEPLDETKKTTVTHGSFLNMLSFGKIVGGG